MDGRSSSATFVRGHASERRSSIAPSDCPARAHPIRDVVADGNIGQQIFESPSVFNFYKPEYQPTGPLIDADLYSPEAELGTAPYVPASLSSDAHDARHPRVWPVAPGAVVADG